MRHCCQKKSGKINVIDGLVAELDDTEAVPSAALYRSPEREQGQGLRYCDLAEAQLARRWPDKYNFDLFAPLAEREQWRNKARGSGR